MSSSMTSVSARRCSAQNSSMRRTSAGVRPVRASGDNSRAGIPERMIHEVTSGWADSSASTQISGRRGRAPRWARNDSSFHHQRDGSSRRNAGVFDQPSASATRSARVPHDEQKIVSTASCAIAAPIAGEAGIVTWAPGTLTQSPHVSRSGDMRRGQSTPSTPRTRSGRVGSLLFGMRDSSSPGCTLPEVNIVAAYLALAGALAGVLLARFSAWRTSFQPIPFDSAAEARIVVWAVRTGRAGDVDPTLLSSRHWRQVLETGNPEAVADFDIADGYEPESDLANLAALSAERREFPGAAPWCETDEIDVPLRRVMLRPSLTRTAVTACVTSLALCVGGMLVLSAHSGTTANAQLGLAAVLALVLVGVVVSSVDHDTLFLDFPTVLIGGGAALASAVAATWGSQLGLGARGALLVAVAWAVVFELTNLAYRLVRKQFGMGFGDTVIVLVSAGVPGVLAGDPLVAFASPFAAVLLALVWHIPSLVGRRIGARTAFALGPFLFAGALVGWAVLAVSR